ncbi:MAG: sugar phosphate isomerase/epimerase [Bryobacteraceae bacterium]|nr:sugar phosphate isomerase/epimerase [Bryobacteraceae bacterium]
MTRRNFFASSFAAGISQLRAAAPGLMLGYDTYSIRAWDWKAPRHLEFAAELKLDAIQISSLGDFESLEAPYLAKIRDQARAANIVIDAGTGCICPSARAYRSKEDPAAHLRRALEAAKAVGARTLRCYLGDSADRYDATPIEQHMEDTIKVFRAARGAAEATGVKIAIENHSGDLQAWEVRTIIEEAGKSYVGACLDTGNPIWCVEHPETTMDVLGPVTVTTHVRDTALFAHPSGCAAHWTALGDGSINFKRIVEQHMKLCPAAPMHLEIITGRPPRIVPYLEESFWKGFPKARASEFARFVALVKQGSPLMKPMIIADAAGMKTPEYTAALKVQQKLDLERSLEYAKKSLGAGVNWRG